MPARTTLDRTSGPVLALSESDQQPLEDTGATVDVFGSETGEGQTVNDDIEAFYEAIVDEFESIQRR